MALAAVTIPTATWAVLVATAAMPGNVRTRLVISDALCEQAIGKRTWVPCYQAPETGGTSPKVMTRRADGEMILFGVEDRAFYLPISRERPPRSRLRVKGVPYGSLAFDTGRMLIHLAPRGGRVYAFDARVAHVLRKDPTSPWHDCLREAGARGNAVFFSGGPAQEIPALRRELHQYYGSIPILYARNDRADAMRTLSALSRKLNSRKTPDRPMPIVVTADAELAQRSAAKSFPTHLVAHRPAALKTQPNLHVHATFAELKTALAAAENP